MNKITHNWAEHIAFGGLRVLDQVQGVLLHLDAPARHRLAVRERFAGDIDHVGIALGVKVGQGGACVCGVAHGGVLVRNQSFVWRAACVPGTVCALQPAQRAFDMRLAVWQHVQHKPCAVRLLPGM